MVDSDRCFFPEYQLRCVNIAKGYVIHLGYCIPDLGIEKLLQPGHQYKIADNCGREQRIGYIPDSSESW